MLETDIDALMQEEERNEEDIQELMDMQTELRTAK